MCDPIIIKAPFACLVKEIIFSQGMDDNQVQAAALSALQQGTEDILVSLFQDAILCKVHAKHVTIKPCNLRLAIRIHGDDVLHL